MESLAGKIALVTGAGSGIGRATSVALAKRGARLVLCDIDELGMRQTEALVRESSECIMSRVVDVSKRDQVAAFASEVHDVLPALDVLVNNAGVAAQGGILDTDDETWDWLMGVNLEGVRSCSAHFIPRMVDRGIEGHVVNISSMLGYWGGPDTIAYTTSKFAVFGFSSSLRCELRQYGIGVSAICPGIVRTRIIERTRFTGGSRKDEARQRVQRLYDRRNYPPERVGAAVVKGILKNKAIVPVSPEAWAAYYLNRVSPALARGAGMALGRLGR